MSVDQLLAAARDAFKRQQLIAPSSDNAFAYYEAALQKDPGNRAAADALRESFPFAAMQVESLIRQNDLDGADRGMELLDLADPGNYTLTTLRAKLDAARGWPRRAADRKTTLLAHGQPHVVDLRASADSWIEVIDAGGNRIYAGVLHAGERRSYHSTEGLDITVGNAGGVTVDIDGQPLSTTRYRRDEVAHFSTAVVSAPRLSSDWSPAVAGLKHAD